MKHIDYQSLKHLKRQGMLNRQHAKWIEFIKMFIYAIKYKQSKENIVASVLSLKKARVLKYFHTKYNNILKR
jgi:hypothetical protein